ncbi:MAG TPA: V-type ATP synthase subunit F [Gemmatimonadales bacterium]|nr:V-type ATP synthase subunit F [Gemmatimonadales bacterium]
MTAMVRVVCRPVVAPGFGLAGITADTVGEDAEAGPGIDELVRRGEAGVVLLQEQLYDDLPPDLRARIDRSATPVVVPFPGPSWAPAASAEEWVVALLRRAIGYRVKLR